MANNQSVVQRKYLYIYIFIYIYIYLFIFVNINKTIVINKKNKKII